MSVAAQRQAEGGFIASLNGKYHRAALGVYIFIVLAHWAEHLVQAYQIWGLGWARPKAKGVLGFYFPWLVTSEWMHYGYAAIMLIGLFLLRPGFTGRAKTWWTIALAIQFWHHIEHLFLLLQVQFGFLLPGTTVPTSFLQLAFPRVELHLFYNSVVFLPMLVAMYFHLRPNEAEQDAAACTCAGYDGKRRALALG